MKSAGVNEPSGITLVDPVSDKEYGVVYDSQLHPQASKLPFQSIGDNSLHLAWAKFPAPPPTTRTLDVLFPSDGPQIPNVPLSDTPGDAAHQPRARAARRQPRVRPPSRPTAPAPSG